MTIRESDYYYLKATDINLLIQRTSFRKSFEDDRFHWNPVTNSVIESPREDTGCSFSSIMQEEVTNIKNLELERNKPLSLIQVS